MTPEERRFLLGIPFHATESEHEWRWDGYCNCGASKPKTSRVKRMTPGGNRTRGKSSIDVIEKNSEANF